MTHVITRQIDGIAKDTEAQLSERINELPRFVIQVDVYLFWQQGNNACFCAVYFSRQCPWGYVVWIIVPNQHHSCRTIRSLNDYLAEKLNWSFCVGVHTDKVAATTGGFLVSLLGLKRSHLNVILRSVSSIEKCWLAGKCHLNLTTFCMMWFLNYESRSRDFFRTTVTTGSTFQ